MIRHDTFNSRMEGAKLRAQINRNAGRHVGTSAKGWNVQRSPMPDEFSSWAIIIRGEFASDCRMARNDFAVACMTRPGEEVNNEIPF